MNLVELDKRVRVLEQEFSRRLSDRKCNCRLEEETRYHTGAELAQIMDNHCPAHAFRDLGHLTWVSVGMPLRSEDRDFCSCARCAVREFVEGTRGPLTKKEQEKECRALEEEFTKEADEKFQTDQAQVRKLLLQYERAKRRAYAKSTAMPVQNKRR